MAYNTAITELRQLISDTGFNKRASKKQIIGNTDGTNKEFITYDKRLFADSFLLYINDVLVTTGFSLDDPIAGTVIFTAPPDNGVELRATYYWQWWTDDELKNFLNKAAEQIGVIDPNISNTHADAAYLLIPPGLKTPTLKFAAHLSTDALVNYLIDRKHSSEYLLEQDGNTDEGYVKLVETLQKQASTFMKDSLALADRFYKRQGRQYAPAFGIKNVNTRQYGPRR